MMFNGSWGDQPSGRFNLPLTTLFFGGADGRRLSSVVEIVIWTFDECHVAGVQFNYADASQTECLGQIGPFSDDHPAAQKYDWFEGRRIPMSIDGPGGEVLQRIEVQEHGSYVVGLKVCQQSCAMKFPFLDRAHTMRDRFAPTSGGKSHLRNVRLRQTRTGLLSSQRVQLSWVCLALV